MRDIAQAAGIQPGSVVPPLPVEGRTASSPPT
ncbi:MAG: hypothetical protein IPG33_04155, partial [Betaproteobacteria bacterium]|nr:hypothetical protein [Betaproteobacteria bacterium]